LRLHFFLPYLEYETRRRRGVISTALFISSSSEPSDAGYCSLPRFLRIDSPCISIRWAWCTSRVQDAVGERRVADLGVPLGHGQLAGQDRRTHLITVF